MFFMLACQPISTAAFADPEHTAMLRQLEADIAGVTIDGKDVGKTAYL